MKRIHHIQMFAAVLILLAVTLLSGGVQGRLSHRWGKPKELENAGISVGKLPEQFGDWVVAENEEMPDRITKMLQCSGYIQRIYENKTSRARVSVMVLAGPPGPLAAHTPEICYSSREWAVTSPPQAIQLDEKKQPATLWFLGLQSTRLSGDRLNVYYGWNDGQGWQAPSQPRLAFMGRPILYKVQVAASPGTDAKVDVGQAFLTAFLPIVDATLFDMSKIDTP